MSVLFYFEKLRLTGCGLVTWRVKVRAWT